VRLPPSPTVAAAAAPAAAPAAPGTASALRLDFAAGEAALPPPSRAQLDAFARRAAPEAAGRIVVMGYGDDPEGDLSRARRLALSRAVEVRAVLVASGIRPTRIDVRAIGRPTDGGPADRVDVSLAAAAPTSATR
jgi:outer membrane protein OmpA-like peptidoglycan-associated protein